LEVAVRVTDPAGALLDTGWTLSFTYSAGQRITSAWQATVTQASGAVNAGAENYNRVIAPGASVTFGLLGT
jgi:endoglucanase